MSNDRANALERQPSAMNAKQTPSGLVLTLGDVLFDSGRATPNLGAGHTVDQPATDLKENPQRTVQTNGYTDSTGSAALNQNLSDCHANSVKAALITGGSAPSGSMREALDRAIRLLPTHRGRPPTRPAHRNRHFRRHVVILARNKVGCPLGASRHDAASLAGTESQNR
jgi:OmpA family